MAKSPTTETPGLEKIFPVSWDQFHRDSRALAWRLHEAGPFEAIVCISRGGLVPAAIVARELNVRMIETVCVVSYRDYKSQGDSDDMQLPVMHCFRKREGEIFHFWSTESMMNHVDTVWPYWNLMDFTPEGRPDRQTPPQRFRSEFLERNYLNK